MKQTEIHAEFRFVHIVGESNALRHCPDDPACLVESNDSPAGRAASRRSGKTGTGQSNTWTLGI
jgi:hypothetical protein